MVLKPSSNWISECCIFFIHNPPCCYSFYLFSHWSCLVMVRSVNMLGNVNTKLLYYEAKQSEKSTQQLRKHGYLITCNSQHWKIQLLCYCSIFVEVQSWTLMWCINRESHDISVITIIIYFLNEILILRYNVCLSNNLDFLLFMHCHNQWR